MDDVARKVQYDTLIALEDFQLNNRFSIKKNDEFGVAFVDYKKDTIRVTKTGFEGIQSVEVHENFDRLGVKHKTGEGDAFDIKSLRDLRNERGSVLKCLKVRN